MDSVTGEVSTFIVETQPGDVPLAVVEAAKRSILDGFGLAVAGARTDIAQIARKQVQTYGELTDEAAVLGTTSRFPARFAAFLNGLGDPR